MVVSRWILVAVLIAVVGCSESKQGGGTPPKEDWRDKKLVGEMRPKIEGIKVNLRNLQIKLSEKDPQKFAPRDGDKKQWQPHEDYLSDPTYNALHTQLTSMIKNYNSILDQNPSWNMERLDAKLD